MFKERDCLVSTIVHVELIMDNSKKENAFHSVEDGENESHQLINQANSGDNIHPALSTFQENNFQYDQYQDSEISSQK